MRAQRARESKKQRFFDKRSGFLGALLLFSLIHLAKCSSAFGSPVVLRAASLHFFPSHRLPFPPSPSPTPPGGRGARRSGVGQVIYVVSPSRFLEAGAGHIDCKSVTLLASVLYL